MILVPLNSFDWSARLLEPDDLEANIVDIQNTMISIFQGGYNSEKSVYMWKNYERALLAYQQISCHFLINSGRKASEYWDTTRRIFLDMVVNPMEVPLVLPPWMGYVDLHISHQSILLSRNFDLYKDKFPGISTHKPIVWPIDMDNCNDVY